MNPKHQENLKALPKSSKSVYVQKSSRASVLPSSSPTQVKQKVAEKTGESTSLMRLIFAGRQLEGKRPISSYRLAKPRNPATMFGHV